MRSVKSLQPTIGVRAAIFLFLFLSILFTSCQKSELKDEEQQQAQSYGHLIPKIESWLDEQKNGQTTAAIARIDSLKSNLNYEEIRLETFKDSKVFIVVPVSKNFKSRNNSNKNPVDYLVLVFENQDSITRGNIIQYVSTSRESMTPKNTFTKIFAYQSLDCNGQFTILSITDFFKFELVFENGKLKSVTDKIPRLDTNKNTGRTDNCTDWYLITTVYYTDGTSSSYEEYLFTSCSGDPECQNTRIANGRGLRINCGGGGSDIEYEYEYLRNGEFRWTITPIPTEFGGGFTIQTNLVGGKFNPRHPDRNRFNYANRYGTNWGYLGYTWDSFSHINYDGQADISSNTTVDFMAKGRLVFPNTQFYDYLGTRTASFSQITWY